MLNYDEYNDYKNLEYDLFDGESFHFFTILELNKDKDEITVVIQHLGKITTQSFDLLEDTEKALGEDIYFEYGPAFERIYLNDFTVEA